LTRGGGKGRGGPKKNKGNSGQGTDCGSGLWYTVPRKVGPTSGGEGHRTKEGAVFSQKSERKDTRVDHAMQGGEGKREGTTRPLNFY